MIFLPIHDEANKQRAYLAAQRIRIYKLQISCQKYKYRAKVFISQFGWRKELTTFQKLTTLYATKHKPSSQDFLFQRWRAGFGRTKGRNWKYKLMSLILTKVNRLSALARSGASVRL
jgi:hypothetical protein